MINTKHSCTQSNNLTNNVAHGHKRVKVRTIDGRQFGLIHEDLICYAWVGDGGGFLVKSRYNLPRITHKLPNKLVQAWIY